VDLVGGIMIAFHRAFEMGDKGRALGGQIVIVFQGIFFLFISSLPGVAV